MPIFMRAYLQSLRAAFGGAAIPSARSGRTPCHAAAVSAASSSAGRLASSVSTGPRSWWRNQVSCRLAYPRVPLAPASATPSPVRWPGGYSTAAPTRGVGPVALAQHAGHFFDEPAPHHLPGPHLDPLVQHGAWRGEPDVPRRHCALAPGQRVPCREGVAGEQRDLDGAAGALAPAAGEAGVEPSGPAYEVGNRKPGDPVLQRPPPLHVERRLDEEAVGEGANVEAGAAHHDREPPPRPHLLDPPGRLAGESAGAVALAPPHQ